MLLVVELPPFALLFHIMRFRHVAPLAVTIVKIDITINAAFPDVKLCVIPFRYIRGAFMPVRLIAGAASLTAVGGVTLL